MAKRENGAGTEPKQEANGRWSLKISYRDPETDELKRTTIRGASRGEVLNKKKDFSKSIEVGVKPTTKKLSLSDWLDSWLEVNKKGVVSNKSYLIYKTIVNTHIKGTKLGAIAIDKIKRVDIQKFLNEKGKSLAPSYLEDIKIVIADALNIAEIDRLIITNPCKNIKLPPVEKKEINPLNQQEIKSLLDVAGSGSLMYNIIFFTLHTGVRLGEACGLKWCDVDYKKKQIYVRQQAKVDDNGEGERKLILGTLKTKASYRTIPIGNRVIEVLKWHKAQQDRLIGEFGESYNNLDLVFCEPEGNIVNPTTTGTRFSRIMAKTPIEKRTFHQLRHTFASIAVSLGLNIKAISAVLGHEKTSTTLDIYGHLLPGDTETVIQSVAAYYGL